MSKVSKKAPINTSFTDAIAKPSGGLSSPKPASGPKK